MGSSTPSLPPSPPFYILPSSVIEYEECAVSDQWLTYGSVITTVAVVMPARPRPLVLKRSLRSRVVKMIDYAAAGTHFHRILLDILSRKGLQYDSVLLLTQCCVEEVLLIVPDRTPLSQTPLPLPPLVSPRV